MSLLLPTALLGLMTLPVILLLHLLRNRRQELPIPSLQLWRGLEQRKRGALPRNIPLSLMLLLQLAVAAAITMALARPVVSIVPETPKHTVFVLDVSTSMAAQDATNALAPGSGLTGGVTRFDVARQSIQEQIAAMSDVDSAVIVALGARPEVVHEFEGKGKGQALQALGALSPGGTGVDLHGALTLANGLVKPDQQSRVAIYTDGSYAIDPNSLPSVKAPVTWEIVPHPTSKGAQGLEHGANQALLSASSKMLPDGSHRLFARIANFGQSAVSRTLRIAIDGRDFDSTVVAIQPFGEVAQTWTLPEGVETATLEIVEPDVLPLDNRASVPLVGVAPQRVLLVSNTPDILARALEAQQSVDLVVSTSGESYDYADFDLIVYDGPPPDLTALPAGSVLAVNPPLGHPLFPGQGYSRRLRPDPATATELLTGVDLSGVYFGRAPRLLPPEWAEVDLSAMPASVRADQPELPLVFHGSMGDTRLVVWAFDLEASNLPARLALPLLTANTLSYLTGPMPPAVVAVGEPVFVGADVRVEDPAGARYTQGGDAVFDRTQHPGLYRVYDEAENELASFAAHSGSALESNLTVEMPRIPPGSTGTSAERETDAVEQQNDLWPLLVVAVLGVMLFEGWLAWRR